MRAGLASAALAAVLLCGCKPASPVLAEGAYLRADYIDLLKKTRSPSRAQRLSGPLCVEVSGDTALASNFHEGVGRWKRNGFAPTDYGMRITTLIPDSRGITLGFGEFKPAAYSFVGDLDSFIAAQTLAGTYTDDSGAAYVFERDRWAVFPDRKFRYRVGVDYVVACASDCETFTDETTKKDYIFEWSKGCLRIFLARDDEQGLLVPAGPKPTYSLRPRLVLTRAMINRCGRVAQVDRAPAF